MSDHSTVSPDEVPPLPERARVLVTVLTYAKQVGAAAYGYATGLLHQMQGHPRLARLDFSYSHGYPTDRARNAVLKGASEGGFDFVLMIDADQIPDLYVSTDPAAKPFLPTALDFAYAHGTPCCVGAPYCAGPPTQDVVVMKNAEQVPDLPDGCGWHMRKYTRDEAAVMTGVTQVAALPTGCLLIDTRVCSILHPPWFYYEYADPPYNTRLASTEDVVFTRNLHWSGVPQFCAWDCWAGHDDKGYVVGKPRLSPVNDVPVSVLRSWEKGWRPPGYG